MYERLHSGVTIIQTMKCIASIAVLLWIGVSCSKDQFPKKMAQLVRRVRMSDSKIQTALELLQTVESMLSDRWPGCKVELLGSMAYGLAMTYSDMDCTVNLPNTSENLDESKIVKEAKAILQQNTNFINFFVWTNLTVPVITFDDTLNELDVDTSFNTYNELKKSRLVKYLTGLNKSAYYLPFFAKYWSRLNYHVTGEEDLPRNHGMIMLSIFYLQQKRILPSIASLQVNATPFMIDEWNFAFKETNSKIQNNDSLSSIIGGFFSYYNEFDFENYIISPYVGYPIKKSAFKQLETVPDELALYKKNVQDGSQPLQVTPGMMIQDEFIHNECINNNLIDTRPGSPFRVVFEDAARRFQEDRKEFLKDLRRGKSYVNRVIIANRYQAYEA